MQILSSQCGEARGHGGCSASPRDGSLARSFIAFVSQQECGLKPCSLHRKRHLEVFILFWWLDQLKHQFGKLIIGFLVNSVKNLPAVQETWVRSLRWEDPLEKEMANHSSILAWKIPWTEEPGGLQSMGCMTEHLTQKQLARGRRTLMCVSWCIAYRKSTVRRMLAALQEM